MNERTHASEDGTRALCGQLITRDHPASTEADFSNVDCLECIMLLQAAGKL